jgi:hypothetical protein
VGKGTPSKMKKKGSPFGVIFINYYSSIVFTEYDSNGDFVTQISSTKEDFYLQGDIFQKINNKNIDIYVQILDQRVILDHNVMNDVKSSDLQILSKQHLDPTILIGNTYIKKLDKTFYEINSIFLQRIDSDEVCSCIDTLIYLKNKILGVSFFNLSVAEFFSHYFNNYSKDKIYATIVMDDNFNLYLGALCHDRALIMRNDKITNTNKDEVKENILRQIKTSIRYLTNRVPESQGLEITLITYKDIFDSINPIEKCQINIIKTSDLPYKIKNKDGSIDIVGSLRFVGAKSRSYFSISNKLLKLKNIKYNLRKMILPTIAISFFAIFCIMYKAFFTKNEENIKISLSKKYISDIKDYIEKSKQEIGDQENVKSILDVYKTYNISQMRRSVMDDYNLMTKVLSKINNTEVVYFQWTCIDKCSDYKSFSSQMNIKLTIYNRSGYIDDMTNTISETSRSIKKSLDQIATVEQTSSFGEAFVRGKVYDKTDIDYKVTIKHDRAT